MHKYKPPAMEGELDSNRRSSNAKSVSKQRTFQKGFRQLQLPALIAFALVVYGITRSEQLLTIIQSLVVAFLCSMGLGYTPLKYRFFGEASYESA